jgi:hypothetical protein
MISLDLGGSLFGSRSSSIVKYQRIVETEGQSKWRASGFWSSNSTLSSNKHFKPAEQTSPKTTSQRPDKDICFHLEMYQHQHSPGQEPWKYQELELGLPAPTEQ